MSAPGAQSSPSPETRCWGVAEVLATSRPGALFASEVVAAFGEAELAVVNLECCISTRGKPWPDAAKPFFFRAPPVATEALTLLGVDCVSLANNHALDFGTEALLDTFDHLTGAGITWVGTGVDIGHARWWRRRSGAGGPPV